MLFLVLSLFSLVAVAVIAVVLFCFVLFWSVALLAEFYSAVVPIDVAVAAVAAATEFMF